MRYIPKFQQGKRIIKVVPKQEIYTHPTPYNFQKYMNQTVVEPVATNVIMHFEKFRPNVYQAKNKAGKPIDKPTIGYGLTEKKYIDMKTMTEPQAREGLKQYIREQIQPTLDGKPYYTNLSLGQRVGLTDLIYNIGPTKFNRASPNLQKTLKVNVNGAVVHINHGENQPGMGGLAPRREFDRAMYSWKNK